MTIPNVDPNLISSLITILVGIGGWLWHKARGDKQASIESALGSAIKQEVSRLLHEDTTLDKARAALEWAADAALDRIGIKRSAAVDLVVHALIEDGLARIAERLYLLGGLKAGIDRVAEAAAKVEPAFTPPATPTVPPLDATVIVGDVTPCGPDDICASTVMAPDPAAAEAAAAKVRAAIAKEPPR